MPAPRSADTSRFTRLLSSPKLSAPPSGKRKAGLSGSRRADSGSSSPRVMRSESATDPREGGIRCSFAAGGQRGRSGGEGGGLVGRQSPVGQDAGVAGGRRRGRRRGRGRAGEAGGR